MASPALLQQWNFASLTLSAANDKYFAPIIPIKVLYVGFIVGTTLTTTAAVLTWDITKLGTSTSPGAVSPSGAAALGTTTATSSTMAAGLGVYLDVSSVKGNRVVYPGEAVHVYASTTAAAGAVVPVMIFENLGFVSVGQRDWVSSHPGATTNPLPFTSLTAVVA